MSLYKNFAVNADAAEKGIWYEPDDNTRIRIARAGEGNKKFEIEAALLQKRHGRAIAKDLISTEQTRNLQFELYAKAVVTGWQHRETIEHEYEDGIEQPDGTFAPVTVENVIAVFRQLPDLFIEIRDLASSQQLYRVALLEETAKN